VPHLGQLIRNDIESVIDESDLLVVGLSDARVVAALKEHVRPDQTVLDLVKVSGESKLPGRYTGLCW
jgi:GDP-mannose 6-dehydrogenase